MRRILVTGGTGFVGSHLCAALVRKEFAVRAAVRAGRRAPCDDVRTVGDFGGEVNWQPVLEGVDVVVHLAARAHVSQGVNSSDRTYMEVNAHATRALAEAAATAGVMRFIYVSSAKVNGESTCVLPFTASDDVHPRGAYANSKWLGEKYVKDVGRSSGMECAIVRPPLVYGPGVKANFHALMRWVDMGVPLPFKGVRNSRSLISLWNLTDFLASLATRCEPAAGTWMVSDDHDLSTSMLVELIGRAMGRRVRLFKVPEWVLQVGASAMGLRASLDKLYGSLTVDIKATTLLLGWRPVISVQEGIARTVEAYLEAREV